ncbi:MAG: DUF3095 family protein, partial [Gammaproteobacteria bacterium]|nr:DUF3095 family protein [Gammaproteobacteria bacterium]
METEQFYTNLPVINDFSEVTDLANYTRLPDDWHMIVADIRDSTGSIRAGLYKAVNISGVSIIISVCNAAKGFQLPYVFGGDGATLAIPPTILDQASSSLMATRRMIKQQFGLDLRVGIIPVRDILASGREILVLRHRVSDFYTQAAFAGEGVEYAEDLIKDEATCQQYLLDSTDDNTRADYSGLECRWDNVPSRHGETIALIVKATGASLAENATIYNEIIAKISALYGEDEFCRPVYIDGLRLTYDNSLLDHELKVRTFLKDKRRVIQYWMVMRIQNLIGWLFMLLDVNFANVAWGDYKKDLVTNTDFKKFDGV